MAPLLVTIATGCQRPHAAPQPQPQPQPPPQPPPASNPAPSPASARSPEVDACAREADMVSGDGPATQLRFVNQHRFQVDIYWRDPSGKRIAYGRLGPGQIREQATYQSHVWVATDPAGACVAVVVAGNAPRTSTLGQSSAEPPPAEPTVPDPTSAAAVAAPPAALGLPPFYRKHVDAGGVPIVSSAKVPDAALIAARRVVLAMLAGRADILARLIDARIRIAIMAESEVTVDIPEHADLYQAFPGTDWNTRARGLGATHARPASSAAEENVLCYPSDRYRGESILVHEFAHTMYVIGIARHEPAFVQELEGAHAAAIKRGLWAATYAATNIDEYWAEGVQDWFDTNLTATPANGVHNEIHTRAGLKTYDPALAALIERIYGDPSYRFACP